MQIVMNEFSGRLSAYLFGFGLPFEAPGLLFEFPDRHLANPIKIIKKKVSVMNNSEEKSKTSWEVIGECPECGSDVLRARCFKYKIPQGDENWFVLSGGHLL